MTDDLKRYNKDGTLLNLVSTSNRNKQANWIQKYYDNPASVEPSAEDIKCELQLQALTSFEPLNFLIEFGKFRKEIESYKDKWQPYLRREGVSNDRESLLIVGQEGDTANSYSSRPEACIAAGRELDETDFNIPTDLFYNLESCHKLLTYWKPIGRTMLVKTNAGGWFPPHKDEPLLNRTTFRIAAFIGTHVDHEAFEWEMDGRRWPIKQNRAYYIDTRKTHRTHSWANDSYHLIINVPKTWENVIKLMTVTRSS
jgi:hypothetical protein|tara:strand:+ start:306 stop:1070 length:765 start_codon:yes stop_codon:yes gene_type:complete